ncbi:hypothetical protein D3C72_1572570 [compost metagenome]
MTAGLGADRGEGALGCAVLLHVLTAGATEHTQRHGHAFSIGGQQLRHLGASAHRLRTVFPLALKGAGLHLFETQRQRTLDRPAFHRLTGQIQGARAGGAIVVDVNHRNTAQTDFIQRRLARGGVTVHITDIGLLHQPIVQSRIAERPARGFGPHLNVGTTGARFQERDHANTGYVRFLRHTHSFKFSLLFLLIGGPEQTTPPSLRSRFRLYPLRRGELGWGGI